MTPPDDAPRCRVCNRLWVRRFKRCPRCQRVRRLTAFNRADGYCRDCRAAYLRTYYRARRARAG